jgi:hypothetical protein
MKKINHDYTCDNCGKPAEYNLQGGGWKLWTIKKNGEFDLDKEWGCGDDENYFYCEECATEEEVI